MSSLAVSGPSPDELHPVTETSGYRPITAYGRAKKLAEDLVNEAGKEFPITIVRPPAVYGPRDSAILTFFQTINRGIAPLIGFDEKKLSLIHARDLARGVVDAAESAKAVGETYFLSSDYDYSWPEVANITADALGRKRLFKIRIPHPIVYGIAGVSGLFAKIRGKAAVLDYEKGHDMTQKYWTCRNDKARHDFGFKQEISLEAGILDTVTWYRKHGWL
jgi:nucleoside-diphosphate-sugar epimerase